MDNFRNNLIFIDGLSFSVDKRTLINSLSIKVGQAKRIGLTGPSGCGKTTLLRSILNKKPPPDAKYKSFEISNRQFGYVPQKNGLLPWYSLRKNIELAVQASSDAKTSYTKSEIDQLLNRYDLSKVASNFPDQLSGGEYKRAVLASAIAFQVCLLVADEPLTGVDNKIKWNILEELTKDLSCHSNSLLLVSHDVDILVFLCDEVIVLGDTPASPIDVLRIPNHHPRSRADMTSDEFILVRERLFEVLLGKNIRTTQLADSR